MLRLDGGLRLDIRNRPFGKELTAFAKFTVKCCAIMGDSRARVIEWSAKRTRGVVVDESDGEFSDAQVIGDGLDPELHGEVVAVDIEFKVLQCSDSIGLEPAECIGEIETEPLIEFVGDFGVDFLSVRRRRIVFGVDLQISASRDYVRAIAFDESNEFGDGGGFMLFVAIHCDQPIEMIDVRPAEGILHGSSVPSVFCVANDFNGMQGEERWGMVGGAVVNDENIASIFVNFAEHVDHIPLLVENGNRN